MIFKNKFLHSALLSLFCLALSAQTTPQLNYFDLREVRLLPGVFKQAEDLDITYLLEMDPDRLLAPFLREANLPLKKDSYTNWENTGLDGHIGGHYLSALAHMYAATGDLRIKERLDYMLVNLKRCQEANGNGYIGGVPGGKISWTEIQQGQINAGSFNLNGKWVPLYNIHKTYAGLRDAYLLTGNESAKDMLIQMTDWALKLVSQLSEAQIQEMLRSEHGGLNETFADVAAITQNPTYLELARKFSHQSILEPLLAHQDHLTGLHANTQIPKVLGFKRIADLSHNEKWAEAVRYFWDNVVEQRSIAIGGNSVSEHFNPTDDFSKMLHSIEGPETCNTYNMLRLTKMLYQTDPQGKYLDFYERALYNHILSTQHPEHGGLVYFTQIRPGHYRVYSQTQTSMWCCVGSGMENHAKYGEMIYAQRNNDLFVNLFIPSRLDWKEKNMEVIQETNFPTEANTSIRINPKKPTSFSLFIRKPNWLTAAPHVLINGKRYHNFSSTNEHIQIKRTWRKGDIVSLELPMGIHTEQLPDKSNYYSILYGPLVLGARNGQEDLLGLQADDSRMGHIASGKQIPLRDLPILKAEPNNIPTLVKPIASKPLHFTLSDLYLGKKGIQMELEPFFGIHDSRYMIYWPQATEKELQALQEKMNSDEIESLALAAKTVDKVVVGEQQPESDHFFREQNSNAGAFGDTRWRDTKDWFSYVMKVTPETQLIAIKLLADNSSRVTEVMVDGKTISTLEDKDEKSTIKTIRIQLPNDGTGKTNIELKIKAGAGSTSHKILEIRTLRPD
ncbi:beta-L-arabinofuranosidase domain-containing protein [uncultured Sphingobacterium sp.]|uniref:beta-L-arabinofuranosidase domain-containing protein n=1 Tax=uncultured Sphingobacterium sp. TaxID=182688 RepID=UPI00374A369B